MTNGEGLSERVIAVIDDDEDVRIALGELLQSFGYETMLYRSADSFLACTRPPLPACVISDVHMPGTSGLELASAVRDSGVPVVLITAYPSRDVEVAASRAGVAALFRKPFDPSRLIERLEQMLL